MMGMANESHGISCIKKPIYEFPKTLPVPSFLICLLRNMNLQEIKILIDAQSKIYIPAALHDV